VTGGVLIGVLAIWGDTGHHVPSAVYWIIAILAVIAAAYSVWLNEYRRAESFLGLPEITLECIPNSKSPQLGQFLFVFSNHSEHVAVDIEAVSIRIPLPEEVLESHRQIEKNLLGVTVKGPSDVVIEFGKIAYLSKGESKSLPYKINGAGPLHGQSFKALTDAIGRFEFEFLLAINFSNLGPLKKQWRSRFGLLFKAIPNFLETRYLGTEKVNQ
jgi:hypothetical protein